MESISINHSSYLTSIRSLGTTSNNLSLDTSNEKVGQVSSEDQVTLSPASVELYKSEGSPRFSSMEEQSASKEKMINSWITLEELENGVRRQFTDPEEARLSTLSLSELMKELNNLPAIDKYGHLQSSSSGTEQGDRLSSAVANITIQSQYNLDKTAENVSKSLTEFKAHIESELGVDPDTYNIKYIDGKITVVGSGENALNGPEIQKIQKLIDNPKGDSKAKDLVDSISKYNDAASTIINNRLIQKTEGATHNRYLPNELSVDDIMNGMDYSNTEETSHLYRKWVDIVSKANESYSEALKDGSHLENALEDPGILELTKIRQNNKSAPQ